MTATFKGKRVLVTGANGFSGSHVMRRLITEGAEVHAFIRKECNRSRIDELIPGTTIWRGDVRDYTAVKECINNSRPQIIFHLAGERKIDRKMDLIWQLVEVNLKGTMNFLQAVSEAGVPIESFLHIGTSEEYGDGKAPFFESQRERPVSPYSASKVATTYFCQMLNSIFKLPIVTLRPFLIYGPGQNTDMFIPSLIEHCLQKKDFPMTAGMQTRDFVYIDDVVDAYIRAAMNPEAIGHIINIGTGVEYSIKQIAEKIVALMGHPIKLLIGALETRPGENSHYFCSNQKAMQLLKWAPKISLDEGLSRTIQWYSNFFSRA